MALPVSSLAGRRARGFTLLEVLMVVALIAVATTMFLVSMSSLGKMAPAEDLEAAFWKTMGLAREQALNSRQPVEMRFDAEANAFVIHGAAGDSQVAAPTATGSQEKLSVVFIEDLPSNDVRLVRGELVTTRPLAAIRVFPDGTSQAFSVEFHIGERKHVVKIDPWTGAAMLSPEQAKGGGQ